MRAYLRFVLGFLGAFWTVASKFEGRENIDIKVGFACIYLGGKIRLFEFKNEGYIVVHHLIKLKQIA